MSHAIQAGGITCSKAKASRAAERLRFISKQKGLDKILDEEIDNKWAGGRKYLDMVDYYEHVLLRQPKPSPKICYL